MPRPATTQLAPYKALSINPSFDPVQATLEELGANQAGGGR
jgi:hypothetical protein